MLDPVLLPVRTIGDGVATVNQIKLRYSSRDASYDSLNLAEFAMWFGQPGDESSTDEPRVQVKCK